jgi:ribonuclease Z
MDLAFDIGRCPPSAIFRSTVAFTHAHMDHMGGIALHCATRSMMGQPPPTYLMPSANLSAVAELLDCWRRLDRSELPCHLVGFDPGDERPIGRDLRLRAFRSVHPVVCNGYSLWRRRRRLRPEWAGRPEAELRRARLGGEEISEEVEQPELVFSGDSRIEIVDEHEVVRKARVLILECTFYDERVSVAAARGKGHIHLDEIIDRAALFENEHILLTHGSARYGEEEARQIVARRLPPSLASRVTLLSNQR